MICAWINSDQQVTASGSVARHVYQKNTMDTTNQTAAQRADRDHAAIQALGIVTKDDTGNTATFYAHGTTLNAAGVASAARAGATSSSCRPSRMGWTS
jgi:hypothetical protein